MKTREELQKIIADATAELERLDKEPTLWVPEVGEQYWLVQFEGSGDKAMRLGTSRVNYPKGASQGSLARTIEQAQWIADFRRVTVPKCKVPEMGQEVYILDEDLDPYPREWDGDVYYWLCLNTGRLKLTPWTDDEIAEYKRIMATNTDWRFM